MKKQAIRIGEIPAILWGEPSDRLYIHVHGKMSRKERAEGFAAMRAFADRFGCGLTVSPDSEHPFMEATDAAIVENWLNNYI